ncbi:hypothetical protein [uncultured Sunxiuqinia sp.]|uniref:ATP-grasp domain-containing protein n=1 Tax=uncultured Sunxiuqinia sp. TaxID=1573825 RepID=UPI002634CF37|nr:hypothetical protein [uncultured Sunxiuqinia sp.]
MLAKEIIKQIVFLIPFIRNFYIKKRVANGSIIPLEKLEDTLYKADKVVLKNNENPNICVGIVKDGYEYEGYVSNRAYYPKYEKFLKNNNISYEYYDIYRHDWLEKAKKFDVIVWHTNSDPATQDIATNKIYVLDKLMNKKCLPSFDEIWTYEDKVNAHYLYQHFNLPEIPTFVSHSKEDALEYAEKAKYPIISKLNTGSASFGVNKIANKRQAIKLINQAFSSKGAKTYFQFQRQKDYILFQEFISDATYDLRIMVTGDKLFGYYRYPKKGDFKASGAGNVVKKAIEPKALDLAFKVKELFKANFLATDLLFSEKLNQYFIIESSIFIGIDTAEQLKINEVPGFYQRIKKGEYEFVEGKYWVQEFALKETIKNI